MASLSQIPLTLSWKPVTNVVGRKQIRRRTSSFIKCSATTTNNTNCQATPFLPTPIDERILNKAIKEPVAFMGGMFAGLLRLDLNEDPLKEWVTRTVEASGFTDEELDLQNSTSEEVPQQIDIE
ncbi:hypothetical protein CTI12_AA138960 [Artemisia annua]|uniref:Uncharacterized protein n=1 Tax=Artemisia annua TaxID=35608 RepID=A0A2U1PLG6_ARTAN|nr:hypothetical protein CTI12_AA138960 [Artemisia annua]